MKAPITYYGGKSGMADLIVSHMPPHRVYIEPFFGSGAVFFAKPKATHEILNDRDNAIVAFFRVLRDRPAELERACRLTPYSRHEWATTDLDEPGIDDLELARRFFIRVTGSFAKSAGSQSGWSVTTARSQSVTGSMHGRIDRFAGCATRLSDAVIESCDAADLVRRLATPGTVIYADPPYLDVTRGTASNDYRCDMGDAEAHEDLADALCSTEATVLLSGYPSPLYDRLYDGWDRLEVRTHAHGSNALTSSRGARTEVLWSNRPLSQQGTLELVDACQDPR